MNKKIWITGASSGIGKSLAIKFAREGWQVAASARRTKLLEELNQNDSNIHPFPLDVVNLENSNKVFKEILEKFEQINLCVFNIRYNILVKCIVFQVYIEISVFIFCLPSCFLVQASFSF